MVPFGVVVGVVNKVFYFFELDFFELVSGHGFYLGVPIFAFFHFFLPPFFSSRWVLFGRVFFRRCRFLFLFCSQWWFGIL